MNGTLIQIRERVGVNKFGLMVVYMKASGHMIRLMERVALSIQMVMFTKENGSMIRLRAMECILIWMGLSTRVTGKKISNMVRVRKPGQMALCTKGIISMVRSMDEVFSNGQIIQSIPVYSITIILKAMVNTNGLMDALS